MSVVEFWDVTPLEFGIVFEAQEERKKIEHEERVTLAYMSAYWTARWGTKKPPPPLSEILDRPKPTPKKMTPEEILRQVIGVNKALGGE